MYASRNNKDMPAMKILTLAALAVLIAAPAMAQWNTTTTPLGHGWSSQHTTGPNGYSGNATTAPLGNGWSSTNYYDNQGGRATCTTAPLGNGWSSTNCY